MTQELEPCPFCGSPFDVTNYGYFDSIISCSGQLCPLNKGMGTDFTILDTPEHRALLNTRHNEPEWLPIETAPKEKAILISNAQGLTNRNVKTAEAYYCTVSKQWCLSISSRYIAKDKPTHWMPLPNPPEVMT